MMNSTEVIVPTLVNFSTFGFLIIIGMAAFVPMAYDLTLNKKSTSVSMVQYYPIRVISRLASTISVTFLLVLSFAFILIGLFALLYFLIENETLIIVALWMAVAVLALLLCFILYVSISAIHLKRAELNDIVEYMNSTHTKLFKN